MVASAQHSRLLARGATVAESGVSHPERSLLAHHNAVPRCAVSMSTDDSCGYVDDEPATPYTRPAKPLMTVHASDGVFGDSSMCGRTTSARDGCIRPNATPGSPYTTVWLVTGSVVHSSPQSHHGGNALLRSWIGIREVHGYEERGDGIEALVTIRGCVSRNFQQFVGPEVLWILAVWRCPFSELQ